MIKNYIRNTGLFAIFEGIECVFSLFLTFTTMKRNGIPSLFLQLSSQNVATFLLVDEHDNGTLAGRVVVLKLTNS